MQLAEKIELVLYYAGQPLDFCPKEIECDVKNIKNRYSELKVTKDFSESARLARVEWIQEQLKEFDRQVSKFQVDLREDN